MKLRKAKKQVPKGMYCYKIVSVAEDGSSIKVKYCPFHSVIKMGQQEEYFKKDYEELWEDSMRDESIEWCKLEKYEIDDSCKVCGLKKNW